MSIIVYAAQTSGECISIDNQDIACFHVISGLALVLYTRFSSEYIASVCENPLRFYRVSIDLQTIKQFSAVTKASTTFLPMYQL